MKLTFEGNTLNGIMADMAKMMAEHAPKIIYESMSENANLASSVKTQPVAKVQGPGPDMTLDELLAENSPVANPVEAPVEKPKKVRTQKQLENDERLRAAAQAKKAAKPAAPAAPAQPDPVDIKAPDPAEAVKVRQKTIEDLQTAYANGHQKEVFDLLARFGNGAKSFRELPPESFVPIREAIDSGALT